MYFYRTNPGFVLFCAKSHTKTLRSSIFIDKQSGKDFERTAYQTLLRVLKKDELLHSASINRLGRNYAEIQNQWRIITKVRGVDIAAKPRPHPTDENGP